MANVITVKTFTYRPLADLARNVLAEHGIEAIVSADDCGGTQHFVAFGMGLVRLLVDAEDAERAREALQIMERPVDE